MQYNDIVFWVEADWVDSGCMSSILSYEFSLYDIRENYVSVASSTNKLGIVFADIKRIDIVVMDVFIIFDH